MGMQRFIGQNVILQGGSFSNIRGDHTYQIFKEVQTDGQTYRQTDRQTDKHVYNINNKDNNNNGSTSWRQNDAKPDKIDIWLTPKTGAMSLVRHIGGPTSH